MRDVRPWQGDPDVLTIQIEAGAGDPPRLILIARPGERGAPPGHVRVREWTGADYGGEPLERVVPTSELYGLVERAQRDRRLVSGAELYAIREWLEQ